MKKRVPVLIIVAACMLAAAALVTARPAKGPSPTDSVRVLFAAFNAHSPERMAELVSEDFELDYMSEGKSTLGTKGPEALRKEMTGYFGSFPSVVSVAEIGTVSGSYVACEETVTWQHEGATRSQFSLPVYEEREGKIRRTWYYPAER